MILSSGILSTFPFFLAIGIWVLEFFFDLLDDLFLIPYIASYFIKCTLVGSCPHRSPDRFFLFHFAYCLISLVSSLMHVLHAVFVDVLIDVPDEVLDDVAINGVLHDILDDESGDVITVDLNSVLDDIRAKVRADSRFAMSTSR
jgi:hypothetical protein